jgi:hypothetical protein
MVRILSRGTIAYIHTYYVLSFGDSAAPEFYAPTFRNIIHSVFIGVVSTTYTTYEDGKECSETLLHNDFRRREITKKKEYNIQKKTKR